MDPQTTQQESAMSKIPIGHVILLLLSSILFLLIVFVLVSIFTSSGSGSHEQGMGEGFLLIIVVPLALLIEFIFGNIGFVLNRKYKETLPRSFFVSTHYFYIFIATLFPLLFVTYEIFGAFIGISQGVFSVRYLIGLAIPLVILYVFQRIIRKAFLDINPVPMEPLQQAQ